MDEVVSRVGRNGRIHIPIDIRRALGVTNGGYIRLARDGSDLIVTSLESDDQNNPVQFRLRKLPADTTSEDERESPE